MQDRQDGLYRYKVRLKQCPCTNNSSSYKRVTTQSRCILLFGHTGQRTLRRFVQLLHSKAFALELYTSWRDVLSILGNALFLVTRIVKSKRSSIAKNTEYLLVFTHTNGGYARVCSSLRCDQIRVCTPITVPVVSVLQFHRLASFCVITLSSALLEGLHRANFSS